MFSGKNLRNQQCCSSYNPNRQPTKFIDGVLWRTKVQRDRAYNSKQAINHVYQRKKYFNNRPSHWLCAMNNERTTWKQFYVFFYERSHIVSTWDKFKFLTQLILSFIFRGINFLKSIISWKFAHYFNNIVDVRDDFWRQR